MAGVSNRCRCQLHENLASRLRPDRDTEQMSAAAAMGVVRGRTVDQNLMHTHWNLASVSRVGSGGALTPDLRCIETVNRATPVTLAARRRCYPQPGRLRYGAVRRTCGPDSIGFIAGWAQRQGGPVRPGNRPRPAARGLYPPTVPAPLRGRQVGGPDHWARRGDNRGETGRTRRAVGAPFRRGRAGVESRRWRCRGVRVRLRPGSRPGCTSVRPARPARYRPHHSPATARPRERCRAPTGPAR